MVSEADAQQVEQWTDQELLSLPSAETDQYEYKSSKTSDHALAKKLEKAASGFWNSGGGYFVAGVDNKGKPNGGIEPTVGRQDRRDWTDQVLANIEPRGPYAVGVVSPGSARLDIEPGKIILVVAFAESSDLPHMADKSYFIRAGAHTQPAGHFLVEALRALRGLQRPRLVHVFRQRPDQPQAVQLGILAVNEAPALDVAIDFDPLPGHYAALAKRRGSSPFPLKVGAIDRSSPFYIDLALYSDPSAPLTVKLAYSDVRGRRYEEQQETDWATGLSPMQMGVGELARIRRALETIAKK